MSAAQPHPEFESLLVFLRDARGFDYTAYKRPTLERRLAKRMHTVGVESYAAYRELLERDPDEFAELFNTMLINVTGFFRDAPVWEYITAEVVPHIVEQRREGKPIRSWSAGCATGAEAYSIAMLFAEALGEDAFRERVKIYATDVDDDALVYARHASYTAKEVEGIPDDLRERYLQQDDDRFRFLGDIRRSVIFGRNDLLQDPPISRVDLLVSRNTLMYFGQEAQDRILGNFSFAMQPRGFLVLGKAEAMHSRMHLFEAYDLKRRVFVKNHGSYREPRVHRPVPYVGLLREDRPLAPHVRENAFEQAPLAQLVVAEDGRVSAINHAARTMFDLEPADVTRPLQDLEVSYRPVDLRSLVDEVQANDRPVVSKDVVWDRPEGEIRHLDVQVSPLFTQTGARSGVVIAFADITQFRSLQEELEGTRLGLETAYEELQSTVEELETTNEELQSTNEELETTNEELQSTNEELETMNEELQATNEELATMNDEMRDRTDDTLHANAFLTSILSSVPQSVIAVDRAFCVTSWSLGAIETWGVREDEVVGEHLLNLDIGLPTAELRDPIRDVLAGERPADVVLDGHNRRGRPIRCTVSFSPQLGLRSSLEGAILVIDVERAGD